MSAINPQNGKLLYHLTHIDNLTSILKYGLQPRKMLNSNSFTDSADPDIILKREEYQLDTYVPFHFLPNTAFDNAVRYKNGSTNCIYICITRNLAIANNFKIIPRHPLNDHPGIFTYTEGFRTINWDLMNENISTASSEDQINIRMTKMAECITNEIIYPDKFFCIYCSSKFIDRVLESTSKFPNIHVNEGVWFNND